MAKSETMAKDATTLPVAGKDGSAGGSASNLLGDALAFCPAVLTGVVYILNLKRISDQLLYHSLIYAKTVQFD